MNEKRAHRGICHECGGRVDAQGYAFGGDVQEEEAPEQEPISQEEKRALFAKALKGKVTHAPGRTEAE